MDLHHAAPAEFRPRHAAALSLVAAAAATAVWVESRSREAERAHPPLGHFIHIDGVRLHYIDRGEGPPVVLLHGNTATLEDFVASGLVHRLAQRHRVIAFDRPGFGHSSRPRNRLWTPAAQAALLHRAIAALESHRPVVLGHAMGATVAMAMALDFPASLAGVALVSGYFYPGFRADALMAAPVALPVLGDALRYTVAALGARAMLGRVVQTMFAPRGVPPDYLAVVPREMLLRPAQLRANAEDAAFMMAQARAMSHRYGELKLPVAVIAGARDYVVNWKAHSQRFVEQAPRARLHLVPGAGHMVHHVGLDTVVDVVAHLAPAHRAPQRAPRGEAQPKAGDLMRESALSPAARSSVG